MRIFARRYPIPFQNDSAISAGVGNFATIFATKLVAMATSLEISKKRGPDRSSTAKMLSFDVKIAKICPVDLEIICIREIIKKDI